MNAPYRWISLARLSTAVTLGHVITVTVIVMWVMLHAGPVGPELHPGWIVLWGAGLAALTVAPWEPLVGLGVFTVLSYSIPRYARVYEAMVSTYVLNWVVGLALSGWVAWSIRTRRKPLPTGPVTWLMLAFMGWLLVAAAVAALRGNPGSLHPKHHPESLAQALVLFFLASQVRLQDRSAALWLSFVICATLCARWIVSGNQVDLEGDISALSVLVMPLALLGLVASPRVAGRAVFLLFTVALGVLMSLTRNRNAAVAFVVLLVVLWTLSRYRWWTLLAAAPVLVVLGTVFLSSSYWERFVGIFLGTDSGSVNQRLVLWQAAGRMIRAHPFFGVGPGQSHNVLAKYAPAERDAWIIGPGPPPRIDDDQYAVHNSVLHVAGESGIPGGLLFLSLFGGTLGSLRRTWRQVGSNWPGPAAKMLFASLWVYLAIGLFLSRHDLVLAYLLAGWGSGLTRVRLHPTTG